MGAGIFIVAVIFISLAFDCAAAQQRCIAMARRALPFVGWHDWLSVGITLPPSRTFPGASRRAWPAASSIRHCSRVDPSGSSAAYRLLHPRRCD